MPPHPFPVILPSRTGRASKRGEVFSRSHRTVGAELGQGTWKCGQLAAADGGCGLNDVHWHVHQGRKTCHFAGTAVDLAVNSHHWSWLSQSWQQGAPGGPFLGSQR